MAATRRMAIGCAFAEAGTALRSIFTPEDVLQTATDATRLRSPGQERPLRRGVPAVGADCVNDQGNVAWKASGQPSEHGPNVLSMTLHVQCIDQTGQIQIR